MLSRSMKLALISFLCITALLGTHQYQKHSHNQQMMAQPANWETAKQGSPTFFQTNPFGMPGADVNWQTRNNLTNHAAAYGLTPPTSFKALSAQNQILDTTHKKAWSGWNYLGLLGLLGMLGLSRRSESPPSD
ncbi:hypothetical protein GCM10008018_28680 [Paenibacillus marchantiophytorum]|uniref:Uncharacterized protein n=1 Tax=Paenibacillus marchantiophytorum TaxID=1619310 RepID=A0ABQ1EPI9_9BACL|nr:hypothetical protein [Paenibacillus marchantiophytorum]GFZ81279.1 hypothetical protein GCM10008018_28680 [Paenibacillus marchantiophytorum]